MSELIHSIPTTIHLYQEGDLKGLDIQKVGRYLTENTEIPFHVHGNVYEGSPEERIEAVARQLARIKVIDPGKRLVSRDPLQGEIDYEKRRLGNPHWKIFGNFYEGVLYQNIISKVIFRGEPDMEGCFILFTNQLFGTWDRDDRRYHARASLYGFPHLISVSGLVEAPAKPREYYLKKQMGSSVEWLKEEYHGRFLDHDDPRMTEVVKGYAMQAFFYHLIGTPFCEDRDCRLFNSHWQEELLHCQLNGRYEFCPSHEAILTGLRVKG